MKFEPNKTYTITSQIFGTGDVGEIVWTIQGATSNDTLIDQNGNLTIGKDEKAKEIVIVATSSKNPEIFASMTINIEENNSLTIILSVIFGIVCLVIIFTLILNYVLRKNRRKKFMEADENDSTIK